LIGEVFDNDPVVDPDFDLGWLDLAAARQFDSS
jgi:hypothetical protein